MSSSSRNTQGSSANNPIDLLSSSPEQRRPSYSTRQGSDESDDSLRSRQRGTHAFPRRPKREPASEEDGTDSDQNGRRTRAFRRSDRDQQPPGPSARASSSSLRRAAAGGPSNPILLGESAPTTPDLTGAGRRPSRTYNRDIEEERWRLARSQATGSNPYPPTRNPDQIMSGPVQAPRTPSGRPSAGPPAVPLRWQPDSEVTLCPICHTQFSFFVRKHHCRKCGRVVCDACSPHRITIPYQYIVQPPGTPSRGPSDEYPVSPLAGEGGRADFSGLGGGQRVRLCNPCVPDPNVTPPTPSLAQLDPVSAVGSSAHTRSQSSVNQPPTYSSPLISRLSAYMGSYNQPREQFSRTRTVSMGNQSTASSPTPHVPPSYSSQRPVRPGRATASARPYSTIEPSLASLSGTSVPSTSRHTHHATHRSHTDRALPAVPQQAQPRRHQIPEEDECPVCHRELPPRTLPDFERRREAHITSCIMSHSSSGTPTQRGTPAPAQGSPGPSGGGGQMQRRTGMFPYKATEKDCVDSAECTICFEEYEVGVDMARLECLCRFHKRCIDAWFEKNPGRCPVHQHDGFGF
ncbi:hypothetical protein GE09DRAFT_1212610 [Coniochaeta sp. 2T2.1]|nr:hypothetical protein GE09DRAFT_1212610 [Coniochaeta sp. 2T2.1]